MIRALNAVGDVREIHDSTNVYVLGNSGADDFTALGPVQARDATRWIDETVAPPGTSFFLVIGAEYNEYCDNNSVEDERDKWT